MVRIAVNWKRESPGRICKMDLQELKFVLGVLEFPEYRAKLSQLQPISGINAQQRENICRTLRDGGWLGAREDIVKFKIAPPGKALLQLDLSRLPISEDEVQILYACAETSATPGNMGASRDRASAIVRGLAERGLIEIEKTQIVEVWLTSAGEDYLRHQFAPSGSSPYLSGDDLTAYLHFLRSTPDTEPIVPPKSAIVEPTPTQKPDDEGVLEAILRLDRDWGTDNYLPIFHLRRKLEPVLSRQELDDCLYRLQRHDKIELSSLQETSRYSPEEIDAGIAQDIGGPLFFIIVN